MCLYSGRIFLTNFSEHLVRDLKTEDVDFVVDEVSRTKNSVHCTVRTKINK